MNRILAVDILRGYFIFVIIIDHLGRFPGLFELFTGKGQLWVSAAEGFFFVSGMMIGLVRGKRALNKPFRQVAKKILSRAWVLYIWSVVLTLGFTAVGIMLSGHEGVKPGLTASRDYIQIFRDTLSLNYAYGWTDFLALYVKFMVFAPVAIWLLRKNMWYLVLAASGYIWYQSGIAHDQGWQILFFGGTILGYYLDKIESTVLGWKKYWQRLWLYAIYGLTIGSLIVSIYAVHGRTVLETMNMSVPNWLVESQAVINQTFGAHFERISLQLPRLAMFCLWFAALYVLTRRYETLIINKTKDFFTLFGQNSLYVFIMQGIVIFFVDLFLPRGNQFIFNVLINTCGLMFFYTITKREILFKVVPR
ncbi:OpgC domain-containing protein [Candidatus Saccharibacteria bacterium]|nr:OpgC domain-containing protein [Candidatus Saccharibacteria bacterium]MCB9821656.1 OpgC domain-containing protein [Candidatus Nomurabacteria bacterium]